MMVASQQLFNLIELAFLRVYPSLKPHISFYSNHIAIWHSFPDITHINVNGGLELAIFKLIKLIFSGNIRSLPETAAFCL